MNMDRRKFFSFPVLLAAIAVFLFVNIASTLAIKKAKLDLTEDKLHTLSQGTITILQDLEDPLTLKLFFSRGVARDIPSLKLFATRVQELLEEYEARSNGKIKLFIIDPEPFSEEEDEAVSLGLEGIPLGDGTNTLYFGMAGKDAEGKDLSIPFFQPDRESFLENDISQMIHTLAHPEKIRVGILTALPIMGGPSLGNPFELVPAWMIWDQLERQYDLDYLEETEPIPDEVDVLLLIHPHGLSDKALYWADQYVLKGKPALVFADPLSEYETRLNPNALMEEENTADRLLEAWGVVMEPNKVVGDLQLSRKVTYQGRFGTQNTNYLPWITLKDDAIDRKEVTTAQLKNLNMASAGSLYQSGKGRTDLIPLLSSTKQSMLIPAEMVAFQPDPIKIISEFSPAGVRFTLGARITGPALTAFPEGEPFRAEGETTPPAHLSDSKRNINVIVIADTDMLQDGLWVQVQDLFGQKIPVPTSNNADLLINALDQLGGSPELIGLRGEASNFRPFTLLEEVAREAELKYRSKEQELVNRLDETEQRLSELQTLREDPESPEISPEQEKELEAFLEEKLRIRKDLREVQFQLRRDIEQLQDWIRFINIGFVPIIIALFALGTWFWNRRKEKKSLRGV